MSLLSKIFKTSVLFPLVLWLACNVNLKILSLYQVCKSQVIGLVLVPGQIPGGFGWAESMLESSCRHLAILFYPSAGLLKQK